VEVVDEVKIEVVVREDVLVNSLRALRAAHPYEEPAITVSEVIDYKTLLPELSQPAMAKKGVPPMSIVLEGLDGVGKSTVAIKLAEILGAKHMVTPPAIMLPAREWFVQQDNHMRKAYYMVRGGTRCFVGCLLMLLRCCISGLSTPSAVASLVVIVLLVCQGAAPDSDYNTTVRDLGGQLHRWQRHENRSGSRPLCRVGPLLRLHERLYPRYVRRCPVVHTTLLHPVFGWREFF
jgi:hypothetical protein